jgi:DNA-binding NarL/FixJ family response regulator
MALLFAGEAEAAVEPWSRGVAILARLLAARAALADGWADALYWVGDAGSPRFTDRGLPALASQCQDLLRHTTANQWSDLGISAREADVLCLVGEGLPKKEIAARLRLSPRTIKEHFESLMSESGARSRTELATRLTSASSGGQPPLRGVAT